jgi:hypothetical protein
MLECIKNEIIPHEVVEEFRAAGTVFYEGMCAASMSWQSFVITLCRLSDCAGLRPPIIFI